MAMVRQREPRENSDFLRVVVLEMNMRRVGKLDGKAAGRARVWLPPRRMSVMVEMVGGTAAAGPPVRGLAAVSASGAREGEGRVPERWIGIVADEV
jgi:hypothetical protein